MASESLKINVNKFNSSEKLISLIRLKNTRLSYNINLVDDSDEIVFEGETFIPFPFRLKLEDQIEGQLPQASLIIPNMAPQIAKWLDSTLGGRDSQLEVIITRRTTLTRDHYVNFEIDRTSITNRVITFSLSIQNNLIKRAIRWTYDRTHAPGLF